MDNREIKFRVWDKLKKEILFEGFHVFGEVTLFNAIGTHAYETRGEKTSLERYNDFEIMQYTGLKDKNGKEIYEGDIIEADHCGIEKVVYGLPYNAAFCVGNMLLGVIDSTDIEIIGNIYETTEKKDVIDLHTKYIAS